MTINEYQDLAMRTNDGLCTSRVLGKGLTYTIDQTEDRLNPGELINGALGLTGEAGEVSDMIKKYIFHRHDLNKEELVKELGDVCWYVALLSHAIDVPLEEILEINIEKLKKRYPDGFSEEKSINRKEYAEEISEIMSFYCDNDDFREYVYNYSTDRDITINEALTHKIVNEVYLQYKEGSNGSKK